MSQAHELDVFACGLDGVNQIEASAGTGKTWNICALYVRLLLEKRLTVEQILVVTFTKAATAELHERIRDRLVGVMQVLDIALVQLAEALVDSSGDSSGDSAGDSAANLEAGEADVLAQLAAEGHDLAEWLDMPALTRGDPFLERLFATVIGFEPHHVIGMGEARLRLQHAVRGFDQAAIHTIHAFCQRALQEAPFAAGLPFEFELATDDRALRFETAAEFWRTQVEPLAAREPGFADWLVDGRVHPEALDAQLVRRMKKPLAQVLWGDQVPLLPDESGTGAALIQALGDAYAQAAALWNNDYAQIVRVLEQAQSSLKNTSHKPELVRAALDAWGAYFAANRSAPPPAAAVRVSLSALEKARKKDGVLPEHAFFAAADTLIAAALAARQWHGRLWLGLVRLWLTWAPPVLREKKRARRTVSFDDLLADLYQALASHAWLATTIRQRYAAALIDEFQDTDPLQFEIFTRVFAPSTNELTKHNGQGAPLFLVGDPKQAIYSFRAADLHTYLAARERASARYTLAVNQRSTATLITACNQIFSANPDAFILPGLDYEAVRAGTRARPPLIEAGRAAGPDFHIWRLPDGDAAISKAQAQMRAAEASAAEIVRLLNGAREQRVTIGERPLEPGDIAVLVQTNKQGGLVKRVLAAWGVGSVELGQASVFGSEDAACLERLLQAIDTPGDPRRLRAALASEWLGLDAHALWQLDNLTPTEDAAGSDQSARALAPSDAAEAEARQAMGRGRELEAFDAASWVERFTRYRLLWNERGYAMMWRTLLHELQIPQRLAGLPDGERRLTNLAHLAELTQTQAAGHSTSMAGIAPVLRWLASERNQPGGGETTQLRLESDRNLVQIVTVHKSKGLEYAVVFCPFLNDGALRSRSAGKPGDKMPDACEYRLDGQAVLHYDGDLQTLEQANETALIEQAAERARLIYVALTRAVYRCYLVSGVYTSGPAASTSESRKSILDWLVAGSGHLFSTWLSKPPEAEAIALRWQQLAGSAISLGPLPQIGRRTPFAGLVSNPSEFRARAATRALRDSWRIASFSALAAASLHGQHGEAAAHDMAELRPDHDAYAQVSVETSAGQIAQETDAALFAEGLIDFDEQPVLDATDHSEGLAPVRRPDDILDFPRGAAAGECLHRMFELADFTAEQTWDGAIARALRERPAPAAPEVQEHLPAMMARLMRDVVSSELLPAEMPGMRLAQVPLSRRLTELEFSFPAQAVDLARLTHVLQAHGYPDMPELVYGSGGLLDGYLKGFIDLVFEYGGRYWVLDWKSNFLGDQVSDYGPTPMAAAMAGHLYTLQALIYTLALHRYLRIRLPAYDYHRHIGGSLYLFIRGVRPGWLCDGRAAGVHADCPPFELIDAMDRLMRGGGV